MLLRNGLIFVIYVVRICQKSCRATKTYSNSTEECEKRKQRKMVGWKAEDADGLTPVKDDNAADSHFTR